MSIQSIITVDNLPTKKAFDEFMRERSIDFLKYFRFEVGCGLKKQEVSEILLLKNLLDNEFCYIDEDENKLLRESIIRKTILKTYEI